MYKLKRTVGLIITASSSIYSKDDNKGEGSIKKANKISPI